MKQWMRGWCALLAAGALLAVSGTPVEAQKSKATNKGRGSAHRALSRQLTDTDPHEVNRGKAHKSLNERFNDSRDWWGYSQWRERQLRAGLPTDRRIYLEWKKREELRLRQTGHHAGRK